MGKTIQSPVTRDELFGDLYFSKRQWKELRDKGRDRTYAILIDGTIKEYTELVPDGTPKEDLQDLYEDAEKVGSGGFDHFRDEKGVRY